MSASTPWQRGRLDARRGKPRLLFGQMYEDWDIEAEVLPPSGRVFCIASAGSTSIALAARGLAVTAVDINPAQVDYVRARLEGAAPRAGMADWFFAAGRRFLPLMGLRRPRIRQFLELSDPSEQVRFWRAHLDTARFKAALALAINPLALRTIYSSTFVRVLPTRFDRTNPYAWRFFLGTDPPDYSAPALAADRIELVCADAAAYLESCPPASFVGFSLSNILDGTEPAYGERLMAAVRRSAQAGAVVVLRSLMEPPPGESTEWAARDRSMLWGRLTVETVH
jgi:hypothetical protein